MRENLCRFPNVGLSLCKENEIVTHTWRRWFYRFGAPIRIELVLVVLFPIFTDMVKRVVGRRRADYPDMSIGDSQEQACDGHSRHQ